MNMFSDIDRAWKNKRVMFVSGKHEGKQGICLGFVNGYSGAYLEVDTDDGCKLMIRSYEMDTIKLS